MKPWYGIPLSFHVRSDYRHAWMLFGTGKAVALIVVDGQPEMHVRSSQEAEEMMSDVLDWQAEVVGQIRSECEGKATP